MSQQQQWQSAPQAPPGSYTSGASGPRAGFWIRFGAFLLDYLIYGIPAVIVFFVAAAISDTLGTVAYILLIIGYFAYFTYFEGGPTGATPGKRICGIRVYDFRGGPGPIGYGRGFIRQIMKQVSAIPIYLGYFWMLWDREKQTWHDKVAGDVVVPRDQYS
jgi:uncharacterized RDD family membrane protein YckC